MCMYRAAVLHRQGLRAAGAWQDFDTIWHSLLTMVGVMLGGPDLKIYYGSHNAGVCIALLFIYVFAMSLVLLNCLIGIMANACTRVCQLSRGAIGLPANTWSACMRTASSLELNSVWLRC